MGQLLDFQYFAQTSGGTLTLVGIVFISVACLVLLFRRSYFPYVLAASAPFLTTSALNIAGNGTPPFFVLAIIATAIAAARFIAGREMPRQRVTKPLTLFVVYCALISMIGPALFKGVPVLVARGGIDTQVNAPGSLDYSISILAQMGYLILAVGVVWYFVQERAIRTSVIGFAFFVGLVLSTANYAANEFGLFTWPDAIFNNYGELEYWTSSYEGEARHRGIYSEPSYLAVFSVAAVAYFLTGIHRRRGARLLGSLTMVGLGMLNLATSYAGTGIAGATILLGVFLLWYIGRFLFRGGYMHPVVLFGIFGMTLALLASGSVRERIIGLALNKTSQLSFEHRLESDIFSVDLFMQSFGLGVGLGANRPSSFLTAMLSCVGIIGTILFAAFLYRLLKPTLRSPLWGPAAWALAGTIACKVVSDPGLSNPMMWLLIAACAHAATRPRIPRTQPVVASADPAAVSGPPPQRASNFPD